MSAYEALVVLTMFLQIIVELFIALHNDTKK